jgi:flagellar motor switch protein FliM
MENPGPNAVLRRKTVAAKEVWQARGMSPAKALRLSLARAADDLWDLAVAASGIAQAEETQDVLVSGLAEDGLIILLDGPEGAIGALWLAYPVVAGLVESQTVGRVSANPPDPRRLTRTDAAILAPLLHATLERFDGLLAEAGGDDAISGFRFGSMIESPRMLSLALKASDFNVFRFTLDLSGLREGAAILMFPVAEAPPDPPGPAGPRRGSLETQVRSAPAELRAVLHRLTMPLSAVSALRPGDVLPIPRDALTRLCLEVGQRAVPVPGWLGQVNGMRAVRICLPEREGGGQDVSAGSGAGPSGAVHTGADVAQEIAPPVEVPPQIPLPLPDTDDGAEDGAVMDRGGDMDLLGDLSAIGDLPALVEEEEDGDGLPPLPMAGLPDIG